MKEVKDEVKKEVLNAYDLSGRFVILVEASRRIVCEFEDR